MAKGTYYLIVITYFFSASKLIRLYI